jgi:hypothetical protein
MVSASSSCSPMSLPGAQNLPSSRPFEVVKIDAIFDVERESDGLSVNERLAVRRIRVAPLV